jgi:glycine/D-amino acid oxidase-like deaminating enzyme
VVRAWGTFRVITADGLPIYERSEACPGAYLTSGHSGVTLAAAHSPMLAPWIAGSALPRALTPFSARRFAS